MDTIDEPMNAVPEEDDRDTQFENPDGVIERRLDDDTQPSEAIVFEVADAVDSDPLDLDPLQDTIDADALDALFRDADDSTLISFSYAGCDVSVSGQGRIVVAPDR